MAGTHRIAIWSRLCPINDDVGFIQGRINERKNRIIDLGNIIEFAVSPPCQECVYDRAIREELLDTAEDVGNGYFLQVRLNCMFVRCRAVLPTIILTGCMHGNCLINLVKLIPNIFAASIFDCLCLEALESFTCH